MWICKPDQYVPANAIPKGITNPLMVKGWDINTNTPYTLFQKVEAVSTGVSAKNPSVSGNNSVVTQEIKGPCYVFDGDRVKIIRCHFMGHYNEPCLDMMVEPGLYAMELDFSIGKWNVGMVNTNS